MYVPCDVTLYTTSKYTCPIKQVPYASLDCCLLSLSLLCLLSYNIAGCMIVFHTLGQRYAIIESAIPAWFLKLFLCGCLYVCVSTPQAVDNYIVAWFGMILGPYDWLNKFYRFYMVAIVGIVIRCGPSYNWSVSSKSIEQSKLVLYKPWIHFNSQLYISNKMKCFSYIGGCGVHGRTCIKTFKIRAGLGYW